jgi:hydroxyethylthiazole kinase-like uncharacterized protein yjeF
MQGALKAEVMELFEQARVAGLSMELMTESAGKSVISVFNRLGIEKESHIVIVVGGGTNGACGLSAARHLANYGFQIQVIYAGEATCIHNKYHLNILESMHMPVWFWRSEASACVNLLKDADVVIEAIVGHGLVGKPNKDFLDILEGLGGCRARIISYDIPAGLDFENGLPNAYTVKADAVIALGVMKKALLNYKKYKNFDLKIFVSDIGIPAIFYDLVSTPARPKFEFDGIVQVL